MAHKRRTAEVGCGQSPPEPRLRSILRWRGQRRWGCGAPALVGGSGFICTSVLTIDTAATASELMKEFLVAHSAGWKRRSNCPCASAGQSTSNSWSFPDEAGVPAGPSPSAPCGVPPAHPHPSPNVRFLPSQSARLSAGRFRDASRRSAPVIAHQAIRMHLPLGFAASLAQREQELLAVFPDHRTIRLCNSHAMKSTEAQKYLFTASAGCATVIFRSVMRVLDIPKSGKWGGTVWQRNRYCQYSYLAFVPHNPRSTAQVAVRGTFSAVSARWRELTEEQRIIWCRVARTKWSKPRLCQKGKLTGILLFRKVNVALANRGLAQLDLPPGYLNAAQPAVPTLLPSGKFDQPPVRSEERRVLGE